MTEPPAWLAETFHDAPAGPASRTGGRPGFRVCGTGTMPPVPLAQSALRRPPEPAVRPASAAAGGATPQPPWQDEALRHSPRSVSDPADPPTHALGARQRRSQLPRNLGVAVQTDSGGCGIPCDGARPSGESDQDPLGPPGGQHHPVQTPEASGASPLLHPRLHTSHCEREAVMSARIPVLAFAALVWPLLAPVASEPSVARRESHGDLASSAPTGRPGCRLQLDPAPPFPSR
jgi:hypothetical protein